MKYNDSFIKIPAFAISTNDADKLVENASKNNIVNVSLFSTAKMYPDALSYNVIAEIKGSQTPEKIITVGGHLDSWDLAEGAHDDGTGCVQSIAVLRQLVLNNYKPNCTIRAVMFMNEENGGKGATAYLDSAISKKEKHLLAMESDGGGFTPRRIGITSDAKTFEICTGFLPLLFPYGIMKIDNSGGGADVNPLQKIGCFTSGYEPDSQRYFSLHHAANDVFENVNKRELNLGIICMTAWIYLVDKHIE